jgi:hypothetical protein
VRPLALHWTGPVPDTLPRQMPSASRHRTFPRLWTTTDPHQTTTDPHQTTTDPHRTTDSGSLLPLPCERSPPTHPQQA